MITIKRSHRHSPTTAKARPRASRLDGVSAPRLRPQLVADAIIAGYIHDISARHRNGDFEGERHELAMDRAAA